MNALVCLNLADCVREREFCFCYTDRALRLVRNSIMLRFSSALCVCMCNAVCKGRLTCECLSKRRAAASNCFTSFFLSQGCSVVSANSCQWWTTAGPALTLAGIHETAFLLSETSSTECWVPLSPIVSSTLSFFLYPTHWRASLDLVGLCLNQWASAPKISTRGHDVL